jgi:hypothetical protein
VPYVAALAVRLLWMMAFAAASMLIFERTDVIA